MNRISAITRSSDRVINVQATEGSHRDNAQCDPELFKAYLTQKMKRAVKELSYQEQDISALISELVEDDLEKEKKKRKKFEKDADAFMKSVKSACLSELNELIELGHLPSKEIEEHKKTANSELHNALINSTDSGKISFNSDLLKQRLFEHHSAYCELNSILEELNEKLASALYSSTLPIRDTD